MHEHVGETRHDGDAVGADRVGDDRTDPSPMVDISILIVNWNTKDLLRACLESVQEIPSSVAVETLVVDNGSVDGSVELVRSDFPWVQLIANDSNLGFAAANNQAITRSRGRYVLLLNSDARLAAGAAEHLVEALDHHPDVAVVGGKLLNPDGTFQGSYYDFPTLKSELLILTYLARILYLPTYPSYPADRSERQRTVDWVNGAFLAARRAAISEVGVLDETVFMYSEEVDWCFRFRLAGWRVLYEPRAVAYHHVGGSAARVPERRRAMIFRGKWWFLKKHRGAVAAKTYLWSARAWSVLMLAIWTVRARIAAGSSTTYARAQAASFRFAVKHLWAISS